LEESEIQIKFEHGTEQQTILGTLLERSTDINTRVKESAESTLRKLITFKGTDISFLVTFSLSKKSFLNKIHENGIRYIQARLGVINISILHIDKMEN
jgi:hypothetical protein